MSPNEQTLGSEHLNNEIQRVFMFWILALTFRTGLIGDLAEKKKHRRRGLGGFSSIKEMPARPSFTRKAKDAEISSET